MQYRVVAMKIFISYRRADSTYLVGRIRDRLTAEFGTGTVFRDLDDIPAGVDFRTTLEEETKECNVMLVIIGPQWAGITDAEGNKRLFNPVDYTRNEVEAGLKRLEDRKAIVIPVLVMNAQMPSKKDLPESLSQLTFQNAISIRNDPDFHNDMEKLIGDIRRARGFAVNDIPIEHFEPETIYIGQGHFIMGSQTVKGIPLYETPQHEVFLPGYRIGKYPITNSQYEIFIHESNKPATAAMGWDGQKAPAGRENYPVMGITWFEALAYCQWLKKKTGRDYTLPNEAQWEKACRGTQGNLYPWGDQFDASRCNLGHPTIAAVDAYPAQNEFGCFDLVGNVRQWTSTLWGEKRVAPSPQYAYPWKDDQRNNLNANGLIRRVLRGSTFAGESEKARCSIRSGQLPTDAGSLNTGIGFRIVMTLSTEAASKEI